MLLYKQLGKNMEYVQTQEFLSLQVVSVPQLLKETLEIIGAWDGGAFF